MAVAAAVSRSKTGGEDEEQGVSEGGQGETSRGMESPRLLRNVLDTGGRQRTAIESRHNRFHLLRRHHPG